MLCGQSALQSPSDYLSYELGTQFTLHHNVLDYVDHVAEQSNRVAINHYGTTYEGRDLVYMVVTSLENHSRLEEIRRSNIAQTGLGEGEVMEDQPAVVWLSYNVHGNEASSSEAAMKTLHHLAHEDSEKVRAWLEQTVVIIDPMLNPDGRDRYVNWFKQVRGKHPMANEQTREHDEPWPGGRVNHYLFDLNRDWAWQIQKETKQRVDVFNRWMPQIHVDFHEQGKDDHYYFAPAAEPFHKAISGWQRDFQTTIGKNHMSYFNDEGWLYFTRQIFDLFYPSYGDTWPTFNGSIGMTYEQAGHSRGGLKVETNDRDTLTLSERIHHHYRTGLSTIEITAESRKDVIDQFTRYFEETRENGSGGYSSFVVKVDDNLDKIRQLTDYLDRQRISYSTPAKTKSHEAFDYQQNRKRDVTVEPGDIAISTHQPKGVLARVLFEPNPELVDSLTYDITAWSIPYAFGLEAYAIEGEVDTKRMDVSKANVNNEVDTDTYAYISKWKTLNDARFLADLLKHDIKVRATQVPFTIDGEQYDEGSLIITRLGNEKEEREFGKNITQIAERHDRQLHAVETGFVENGADFGSGDVHFIDKPRVAMLSGKQLSANRFGEIWHFFDYQLEYPVHIINTDAVGNLTWHEYDVMILPPGSYKEVFGNDGVEKLKDWVQQGGRLIALQSANGLLKDAEGFSLENKKAANEEASDSSITQEIFAERARRAIENYNAGSIFKVSLDSTHPLAFGYGDTYHSLKLNSSAYGYLKKGWNVGVLEEDALVSGFAGHKARKKLDNTLVFGVQNMGSGQVVYMVDNPLFRGFWHNGKLLFANALYMVGQ